MHFAIRAVIKICLIHLDLKIFPWMIMVYVKDLN